MSGNWFGLRCLLMLCPHRTEYEDPEAVYGICLICGQRAGEVTREELRRYGEAIDRSQERP